MDYLNDWDAYFVAAIKAIFEGKSPFSVDGYYNPPWLLFLLAPLAWIPAELARLLPAAALLLASYHRRKPWLIAIVGLSFPFIAVSSYANVDWVPMLGVAYGGMAGPLLVTTKPQAAGLAVVAYFKDGGWKIFVPLIVVAAISTLLWPSWPLDMLSGDTLSQRKRNLSLFPYTIPIGLWSIWMAWKKEDVLLGCMASLCLAPYFYIHSLLPLIFVLADRRWWFGVLATLGTWLIVFLSLWGVISLEF